MAIADISKLGQWLHSWIQPNGAIHGFHNHSVWGGNPYRFLDMTAGHSTFASPLMPALALALKGKSDPRGKDLLESLVQFQTGAFQEDNQFAHIGFQVGEILKSGLIHNVVPDVSLSLTATLGKDILDTSSLEMIEAAVVRNLEACDRLHGDRPIVGKEGKGGSCSNQDYCRLWARLSHMEAFDHKQWDPLVRESLHFMIEHFHVSGIPDAESSGSLRSAGEKHFLEPAEYYGLMIHPLLMGFERYGESRFLEEAGRLIRHVMRGSWKDASGQRRFHRLYLQDGGKYLQVREPMLIGGMGITLSSIQKYLHHQPDPEMESFLREMDATYSFYQAQSGFFLAATGWSKECDIVPASAWQSHDLFHLMLRHGVPDSFWETLFSPLHISQVVLGENCFWMEAGPHWALRGYFTMEDADLVGRKNESLFYRDLPGWIRGGTHPPENFRSLHGPVFHKVNGAFLHFEGNEDIHLFNATRHPYRGPYQSLAQPFVD